ncbi:MAG: hypothetical protein VB108_07795 [Anaerolineaceae bacterium]|nr:hypothetical protein [Anaerolineaceae bacterium]
MKPARRLFVLLICIMLLLAACKEQALPISPATAVAQTMAAAQGTFVAPEGPLSIETAVALTIQAASAGNPAIQTEPVQGKAPANVETPLSKPSDGISADQKHIILWEPDGTSNLMGQLKPLADSQGLTLAINPALKPEAITPNTVLVVAAAPAEALVTLANAAPGTKFLSVKGEVPNAPSNVFIYKPELSDKAGNHEQNAFVAGYLFGLITPDYRAGVISQAGTDAGKKTEGGFKVGEQYYCGICNSRNAPVTFYPKSAQVSSPTNQAEWKAAADALLGEGVTSVFVQPEVSSAALIDYLRSKGVLIIGVEGQTGLGTGEGFVATIASGESSLTLEETLRALLSNEQPAIPSSGELTLINVNRDYLSEGKQAYFEVVRRDLVSGLIKPLPFEP